MLESRWPRAGYNGQQLSSVWLLFTGTLVGALCCSARHSRASRPKACCTAQRQRACWETQAWDLHCCARPWCHRSRRPILDWHHAGHRERELHRAAHWEQANNQQHPLRCRRLCDLSEVIWLCPEKGDHLRLLLCRLERLSEDPEQRTFELAASGADISVINSTELRLVGVEMDKYKEKPLGVAPRRSQRGSTRASSSAQVQYNANQTFVLPTQIEQFILQACH
jgi:hypothetical protein